MLPAVRRRHPFLCLFVAALALASVAQEGAPTGRPVWLERLEVGSTVPGSAGKPVESIAVDTLYQLRVVIRNDDRGPLSGFHFVVEVEGVGLPVYVNQTFMALAPAGAATELRLYNFWSTETGRPAPKDGKLTLVVTLDETYRVTLGTEADGTEVWTLGEQVAGLPQSIRVELPLAAP